MADYLGVEGKEIYKRPGFFLNLKPFPYAIETLLRLKHDGHDILIATNPSYNEIVAMEKYLWIKKYLSFIPQENIIMCSRKDLIKGDLIFDDAQIYLESFDDGISVCMDRPYNKDVDCNYRVHDWLDFYELITYLNKGLTKAI